MDKLSPAIAGSRQGAMDHFDLLHTALQNMCLSAPGLAIGTSSKAKVLIANTTVYTSGGAFKSKTTAEVPFTATTHDIAADTEDIKEAVYLITLAADGTPTVTMGAIATGKGKAVLPERPTTGTPIGYVRIAVKAGSTSFDATTTELDAAALEAVTYTDAGFYFPRFDAAQ